MKQFPMAGGRYYRDQAGNLTKAVPAASPVVKAVSGLAPIDGGVPVSPPAGDPAPAPDGAPAASADADASKKGK
jgi:hypothetical protein